MSYATVLLFLSIAAILAGVFVFLVLMRKTPRGAVLLLAIGLYMLGQQIDVTGVREAAVLKGTLKMLGFAGFILGIADLFRKRKP